MASQQAVSAVLKEAMKGGKFILGTKEVLSGLKSSKAVIVAKSLPGKYNSKLTEEAKKHDVPIIRLGITSSELSRMIGRPFRVSAIGLRQIGDSDLRQLLSE
jgi:large subunit ribosomal protein L30e